MVKSYLNGIIRPYRDNAYVNQMHMIVLWLIRNLRTEYILPQFHVVYDNLFQTVMGGYEDNSAISDQIWSSLVVDNTSNIAEQAEVENEPVPQINVDWLNPTEIQ